MWVCLAVQNYTSIGAGGWESGAKISTNIPLFGKGSPHHGQNPLPISKSFRGFYANHYPANVFQI